MTLPEFFGSAFMAFGPALAMFFLTIAIDPVRVIILIASSFFWLLSLLFSSILWYVIPFPGHLYMGMAVSVIFQEVFRFIVYKLLRKAEGGLQKITESDSEVIANKHILAYVAGLGFGLMSGLFALINVLADAVGPGTVGLTGSGSQAFFMTSAAFTLCFTLLHTFWSVIFFAALDDRNYYHLSWVVLSHFAASGFTLFNSKQWYVASLLPCYIIAVITAVIAYRVAGGTISSLKNSMKKQDVPASY